MDIKALDRRIGYSILFVSVAAILIPGAYALWFWGFWNRGISETTAAWGAFGDFVGGIANPLIAFFAFYWLANSVLLQKTELAETRAALQESKKAQEDQARAMVKSANLQFLNIHLESVNSILATEMAYLNILIEAGQQQNSPRYVINKRGEKVLLERALADVQPMIDLMHEERGRLMDAVKNINLT